MKKTNLVTLLGIALVVALLATGVFYGLFVSNLKSNNDPARTIVVAAKPLEAGKILTADDVKAIGWPAAQLPKGAYEKVEQVAGKTLFDAVAEADPLFSSRLLAQDGSGGNAGVPAGMRAVSIHVSDSSGVVAMLRAGHRVDAQIVVKRGKESDSVELRTAVENLEVLSVSPRAEQGSQGNNLPIVTLLAQPAEADVLALADSGARIRLTLRNALDQTKRTRTSLSLNQVMQSQ